MTICCIAGDKFFKAQSLYREQIGKSGRLFLDYQALHRIWTHPQHLQMHAEKMEQMKEKEYARNEDLIAFLREDLETYNDDSDSETLQPNITEQVIEEYERTLWIMQIW